MHDDKDWTWVLDSTCPECGYSSDSHSPDELAGRIRAVGGSWRELLGRSLVAEPPDPVGDRTWSPLEYGCHVRDVFEVFEQRARLMLKKKRKAPTFKDWNQEAAAEIGDYAGQEPAKVAYALASNAGKFADLLDRVNGAEWNRPGIRSDGAEFTVESLARYVLHDVEHHLWDAREILRSD